MYGQVLYEVAQRSVEEKASRKAALPGAGHRRRLRPTGGVRRRIGGALVALGGWVGGTGKSPELATR